MKPYKDIEVTEDYIIREFSQNIDPIELMWHRDSQHRLVEVVGETDWKMQLENQLPSSLNSGVFIRERSWHRLIKGSGNLTLKIHKL